MEWNKWNGTFVTKSHGMKLMRSTYERVETFFFTEDEAPRRASNRGPLHGNYGNK